jgi:hypothetical protein
LGRSRTIIAGIDEKPPHPGCPLFDAPVGHSPVTTLSEEVTERKYPSGEGNTSFATPEGEDV